jgi:hypothetical protein
MASNLINLVKAALPLPWQTPLSAGQIAERLDGHTRDSIRFYLIRLLREGKIESSTRRGQVCYRWKLAAREAEDGLYRKTFEDLGKEPESGRK